MPPVPSPPRQQQGRLDADTHTAPMKLLQAHWATWKRPLSSLPPAQLTGEPVPPHSHRLWTQGIPAQGSPSTALFSPGVPSEAAVQLPPGHRGDSPCAASAQGSTPPKALPARQPALSEWLLCASCLQRKKTVFAAEHGLEPSIEQCRPKATQHTNATPSMTQNACLQRLAQSSCNVSRVLQPSAWYPTPLQTSQEPASFR